MSAPGGTPRQGSPLTAGADHVDALLDAARAAGVDRLDAQLLLAHVLGRTRAWVIAHGDATLGADDRARAAALLERRAAGEPLAYLVGRRDFHGLDLVVTPEVLDPRPDTETLVEWALQWLADEAGDRAQPAVLDLGTGSGAIALALARACPRARVSAVDASPGALAVARANGQRLGLDVEWLPGSWWEPVAGRRFDLVVSNPPYIRADDPHLPDLRFEPAMALVSGPDGLDALRTLAVGAAAHLEPGGALLVEHGWDQHEAVAALLGASGLQALGHRQDLAGHLRCTGGRRPAALR